MSTTTMKAASLERLVELLLANNIRITSPHEDMTRADRTGPVDDGSPQEPLAEEPTDEELVEAITKALAIMGFEYGPLTIPSSRPPVTVDIPVIIPTGVPAPTPRPVVLSPASIPIPGFTTTDDATDMPPLEDIEGSGGTTSLGPAAEAAPITGFVCAKCNTHNLLRPAKETWYTVTVGRQVGVFQGIHHVQPLVSGARGACYRKYPSREDALAAFHDALENGALACVD